MVYGVPENPSSASGVQATFKIRVNARARWSRHQARWVGGFNASSYAPKIVGKVALGRKLCQFPCRALRLKPLKPINHFTAVEKSMNLGRKGANKAQERAQTLAHGHPWGLGRSLTVILLSLLHVGSHGVEALKGLTPRASSCR